jgi:SAM-dependent methyltransferase
MSLKYIEAPFHLHTNSSEVIEAGIERGGRHLLETLATRLGKANLSGLHILDVGCGIRFTQTIINCSLPIGSYTGVEVRADIVEWLKEKAEAFDSRFRYAHWDVHHLLYNPSPDATPLTGFDSLPVAGQFDVITGFSLFTHLPPTDALHMMKLMRKAVRDDGFMFFSALCGDPTVETFKDVEEGRPLGEARYGRDYLEGLIREAGWRLVSAAEPSFFIVNSFLCSPA